VAGYSWVAVEARTGVIITDLPLLDVSSVKQSMGRFETNTASLPINAKDAPTDWQRATKKNATHLVLLADNPADSAHGIPLIGYRITNRERTEGDRVTLAMSTVESYLDGRYVGDVTYAATGQNAIVTDLIARYVADGVRQGIAIRVQVVTPGVGTLRDRTYADAADKTVYSALTLLAGDIGGPEWYIGWEWQFAPARLTPVLYVGDRIGRSPAAGLSPAAVFDLPGCVASFRLVEDYTAGKGATDVMATSSGSATVRPQSPIQSIIDPDQPTVEYRFTPSTSITDTATLIGHAQVAVAAMHAGSTSVALSAFASLAPQLGIDWFMGDDMGYAIGGPDTNGVDTVPAFPGGLTGSARQVGWELTLGMTQILTPTLISPTGALG
jgi:hypothetical protein